jgi:hypothetical protein
MPPSKPFAAPPERNGRPLRNIRNEEGAVTLSRTRRGTESPASVQSYEVPPADRMVIGNLANTWRGLDENNPGLSHNMEEQAARHRFFTLRTRLLDDARRSLAVRSEPPTRPDILPIATNSTIIPALASFYDRSDGVVIGEEPGDSSGKKLIIESLENLHARGVHTLYLEHLLSDAHQMLLDAYDAAPPGQEMPAALRGYLQWLEHRHSPQATSIINLIEAAKRLGVRVIALDCYASHFPASHNHLDRHTVLNYHADLVIRHTQSRPNAGKWVALVDHKHGNSIAGLAGLAERTQTIGIRILGEALEHAPLRLRLDSGDSDGTPYQQDWLQGDYLLHGELQRTASSDTALHSQLQQAGSFLVHIEPTTGSAQLWLHRSGREVEILPIHQEQGRFHLDSPVLQADGMHLTRFASIGLLCAAVQRQLQLRRQKSEVIWDRRAILALNRSPSPQDEVFGIPANAEESDSTPPDPQEIGKQLLHPGHFLMAKSSNQSSLHLWHRTSADEVVATPIHTDGAWLYIENPAWEGIHHTRYPTLDALGMALISRRAMEPAERSSSSGLSQPESTTSMPRLWAFNQQQQELLGRHYSQVKNAQLLRLTVFASAEERQAFRAGKLNVAAELAVLELSDATLPVLQLYFAREASRLTPRQQGALLQAIHLGLTARQQRSAQHWQRAIERSSGSNIKLIPHNLYLAATERQQGVCAGLAAQIAATWGLDAAAEAAATPHLDHYIDQLTTAIDAPDRPSARIFGLALLEWSFRAAKDKFDPAVQETGLGIDAVVRHLAEAVLPSAYELSADRHAIALGVSSRAGKRRYFLADPNYGYAEFANFESLRSALRLQHGRWPSEVKPARFALRRYRSDLAAQTLLGQRSRGETGSAELKLSDLSSNISLAERFNHNQPLEQDAFFLREQERLTIEEYRAQLLDRRGGRHGVAITPLLTELLARHLPPSALPGVDARLRDITFDGQANRAYVWLRNEQGQPLPRYSINGNRHPDDITFLRNYHTFCKKLEGQTSLLSRLFHTKPRLDLDTLYLASALPEHVDATIGFSLARQAETLPEQALAPPRPEDEHALRLSATVVEATATAEHLLGAVRSLLANDEHPAQWLPLLHGMRESRDGAIEIRFVHHDEPTRHMTLESHDPVLFAAKRYLDQAHTDIARTLAASGEEVPGVDGLNSAFAIQAMLQWLATRDRNHATDNGIHHNLQLAVRIHDYVNGAQLAQGSATDLANLGHLIRRASRDKHGSLSGSEALLGASSKALAKAGVLLQAAGLGLDVYELTQADSERQKAVFGTHLAFDSAGLGASAAGFAGVAAAGPAAVLIAGLGIGVSGLVQAYLAVAEHAASVGRYFARLRDAHTAHSATESGGYRYDAAQQALLPAPAAIFRDIDLVRGTVHFDSPRLYPSRHGPTGSGRQNYFFWAGDMPQMVHDRARAIDIRQRLGYAETAALPAGLAEAAVLHLPALAQHYIGYGYNTLPFATARRDDGFAELRALEGDDFDFDFYIFPSEQIIDHLSFEYVDTPVTVTLGDRNRRIQMPAPPPAPMRDRLHYTLQGGNGQYVLGLQAGAAITLAAQAGAAPAWTLDARALSADTPSFVGDGIAVGGVTLHIAAGSDIASLRLLRQNGDVLRLDPSAQTQSVETVDASRWPAQGNALDTHLRTLADAHQLAARYVEVRNYPLPGRQRRPLSRAYYNTQDKSFLYLDEPNYPDARLAARQGNDIYFYNHARRTKLLHIEAGTQKLLSTYQLATEGPLLIWQEAGALLLAPNKTTAPHRAIYRINSMGLTLLQLRADAALVKTLLQQTRIHDPSALLRRQLDSALCVVSAAEGELLPASGTAVTQRLCRQRSPTHSRRPVKPACIVTRMESATLPSNGYVVIDHTSADGTSLLQRFWLRVQDGAVISPRFVPPLDARDLSAFDMMLVASETLPDGEEILYFFCRRQRQLYRQQGLQARTALRQDIIGLVEVRQLGGRLYAETANGMVFQLDPHGALNLAALTGTWINKHPLWWQHPLAWSGPYGTVSVLDLKRLDGSALPVWLVRGQVIAAAALPGTVEFLGLDPDRAAAWLYDRGPGLLYRQPFASAQQLAAAFDEQGKLRDGSALPPAHALPTNGALQLFGNTLSWQSSQGDLPPAIAGVTQLLLLPDSDAALHITAADWRHYRTIIVARTRLAATAKLTLLLTVPQPLALSAQRDGNDLRLVDRSDGRSLIVRDLFADHSAMTTTVSVTLPDGNSRVTFPSLALPAAAGADGATLHWLALETLL